MYGLWNLKSKSWVKTHLDNVMCYGFFDTVEELISIYAGDDCSLEEFKDFNINMVIVKVNVQAQLEDIV